MTSWDDPTPQSGEFFSEQDVPQEGWNKQQLIRLENEWRRLQRGYAYHPHVRVNPLGGGDPPDQHQVEYRMRTVLLNEEGQLEYASACSVHIWLPPGFPHEPPLVRPISNIFHPNAVADGIAIDAAWTSATSTILDVISLVGSMLAFQSWDEERIYNPTAMEWVEANRQILPTDTEADCGPQAGGEPLDRICRFGPRTLDQVRAQLKQLCDALLATEEAPGAADIQAFARRVRLGLTLFLEEDVPQELRVPAAELDDFARELHGSAAAWDSIRAYRATAEKSLRTAQQMADTAQSIQHAAAAVDAMGGFVPSDNPAQLIRQLPVATRLQLHLGNASNLAARAEQLLAEGKDLSGKLASLPALEDLSSFASALHRRLQAEEARAAELVKSATSKLDSESGRLAPVLAVGTTYAQALRRASGWREYADLIDRGNELSARVQNWGPAGVQAFFIENESGRFGPFELEQKLELGNLSIAARNTASTILEVIAADTGAVRARSDSGSLSLPVTDPESGRAFRTVFQLTGNAEELAVQLDYVARESEQLLASLRDPLGGPPCWLGKVMEAMGSASALSKIDQEHQAIRAGWRVLRDDLRSLGVFKERLATFRMLQRLDEASNAFVTRMDAAKKLLASSTARITAIIAASTTDVDTGQLRIPYRYAKEYPDQLRKRDHAKQEIAEVTRLMQSAAADVRARVDNPALLGFADLPALSAMGELPEGWADVQELVQDGAIAERLVELERRLGSKLVPEGWPPQAIAEEPAPPAATQDNVDM